MTLGTIEEFWRSNDEWIAAVITMALAILLAYLVDRAFQRRADRLASALVARRPVALRPRRGCASCAASSTP